MKPICSIVGCGRPTSSRGWCQGHYFRWRRHGNPLGKGGTEMAFSRSTHGRTSSPEYMTWLDMRRRCSDPSRKSFPRYGGRGISVCDRWIRSFEAFLADMGERPEGTTLDRIDKDGNYEPGNCRWATPVEQSRNRSSNRYVDCDGNTVSLAEYCDRKGFDYILIRDRVCGLGWTLERAVSEPVRPTSMTKQRAGLSPAEGASA